MICTCRISTPLTSLFSSGTHWYGSQERGRTSMIQNPVVYRTQGERRRRACQPTTDTLSHILVHLSYQCSCVVDMRFLVISNFDNKGNFYFRKLHISNVISISFPKNSLELHLKQHSNQQLCPWLCYHAQFHQSKVVMTPYSWILNAKVVTYCKGAIFAGTWSADILSKSVDYYLPLDFKKTWPPELHGGCFYSCFH